MARLWAPGDGVQFAAARRFRPKASAKAREEARAEERRQREALWVSASTGALIALSLDNFPLGIIDPDGSDRGTSRDSNPLLMKNVGQPTFQIRPILPGGGHIEQLHD